MDNMMESMEMTSYWLLSFEIPALGGLFWLIWRLRRENELALCRLRDWADQGLCLLREQLTDSRLEVAREYASVACLRDVEQRLTEHLLRIEGQLVQEMRLRSVGSGGGGEDVCPSPGDSS